MASKMTSERVQYHSADGVGWIELDDGKVNVMSPAMQADIGAALDQAEAEGVVVVIKGRPGVFSGGFDLGVLREGGRASTDMVLGGFRLARRVLAHPRPVLMAVSGHAIAMGSFLALSGDYRVGVRAPTRMSANEVAIGLTMPRAATEFLRQRLTPAAFQSATLLARSFDPDESVVAGLLDEAVEPEEFDGRVREIAVGMTTLDVDAQIATKQRTRAPLVALMDEVIEADRAEYEDRIATSS